jgi:hypothetical protein
VNLAFGTILLVVLLIPPLVFLYFFSKGTHAKGIPKLSLAEYLFLSAVLSLLLHSATIQVFRLNVNYQFLLQFISGQFKPEDFKRYEPQYATYFFGFARYTFYLCLFCGGIGLLAQRIVTSRRLRMRIWLQRLRRNRKPNDLYCYFNNWWYFFRANEYDSAFAFLGRQEPLVYIDALIDTKDGYHPSCLFCLPYSQLLNLHIRFVSTAPLISAPGKSEDELADWLRSAVPKETTTPDQEQATTANS